MPSAHTLTLKPGGSLILSTGISPGALGAGGAGMGASGEFAISGGRPCFQAGGAAGGCCAGTVAVNARRASATTTDVKVLGRMVNLPQR